MKKITNRITIWILTVLLVLSLCSCDFLDGTSTKEEQTAKIDYTGVRSVKFTDAMQNYENADLKRSDVKLTVRCEMNVYQMKNSVYGFGMEVDTTRIANQGKHYVSSSLLPYDTDETTIALVKNLSDYISSVSQEEKTESERKVGAFAETFLATLYHFLDKQVACTLAVGEDNNVYNVKANFNDKANSDFSASCWLLADENDMESILTDYVVMSEESVAKLFMRSLFSLIETTSIENKTGLLSEFVDTDGYSLYDFKLRTTHNLAKNLFQSLIGNYIADEEIYSPYIDTVAGWLEVEDADVDGKAGFDKLPSDLHTQLKFRFNVKTTDIVKMLNDMAEENLISEEEKIVLNIVLNNLSSILRGLKGEEGYIGMNIDVQVAEKFSYSETNCALTGNDVDADLFTPTTENPEKRQNIGSYLQSLNEDK